MGLKVVLLLISVLCCTLLPFARSSVDEVVSSVHLEDTWRTLTEADLRTELHLPRDSHLPFHTIAKLSTVRRKRRDVEAEGSSNKLAFSLSLSNVTHSFDMSPSTDILSPRYVLEEVSEDGHLVTVPSTAKDCYYIQDIRETGLSAVTVCSHTVEGVVVADDHSYVVQPRPQHLDEVIVWEMDERTLPRGVTDGRDVLCPIPISPLDGEVSWSSNEVGAVLHYYCREGFDLVGTASQECLPIGEWSSYTPLCMKGGSTSSECLSLRCPDHGFVNIVNNSASVAEAVYSCEEGFVLRGDHKRYCQRNGQWTGRDPHCSVAIAPLAEKEVEVGSLLEGQEEAPQERMRQRRLASFIDQTEVIEFLVYVDKLMYDRYRRNRAALERHILAIMNMDAAIMQEPSIGRPVYIKVVRMIVETGATRLTTASAASTLSDDFCQLQSSLNVAEGQPTHHDFAILITGRDMCSVYGDGTCYSSTIGYALVAAMCERDYSCGIVEHYGLQSAFTVAHETGHSLSMEHDSQQNSCPNRGGVMAASLGRGVQLYEWSSCSASELRGYRIAGGTKCLMETDPANAIIKPSTPGQQFDLTYQCKAMWGDHAIVCPWANSNICRWFYCKYDDSGYCYTKYIPAMDGTSCGSGKVCRRGLCVRSEPSPPVVNGGWGNWLAWSVCSRTCGGGVQCRSRKCNNPTPKNGGRYCTGPEVQCQLCNERACSGGGDYRAVQCSSYNKPFRGKSYTWELYDRTSESRCSRVCLAFENSEARFWAIHGKMKDGTPCPPTEDGYKDARCVKGSCVNIGCDGCLGSNAKNDVCRVCGGNGSSCTLSSNIFQKTLTEFGYHDGFTIPAGATDILIREEPVNYNVFLAVTAGAVPPLNGGSSVVSSASFQAGGAEWSYTRKWSGTERLECAGPLSTSVHIQMVVRNNQATTARFSYQFYKPKPTSSPSTQPPTTRSPTTQPPTTRPPTTQATETGPKPSFTTQTPTTKTSTTATSTAETPTTQTHTTPMPTTPPPTTQPPTNRTPTTQPPTTQPTGSRPTSTVTRTFSATNQRFGYLSAVTIPAGARGVVIREDPVIADNYLALSSGGIRVLNANSRGTQSHDFSAAGVTWQYRRSSTAETLSASGTLMQAADVEVHVGRNGNNARLTYEYVVDNPITQTPSNTPNTQPPTTRPPTTRPTTTRPPTTQPPTNRTPTTQSPTTTKPFTTSPPPPTTQPPPTATSTPESQPPPTGCPDQCRNRFPFCSKFTQSLCSAEHSVFDWKVDCCCTCSPTCAASSPHC